MHLTTEVECERQVAQNQNSSTSKTFFKLWQTHSMIHLLKSSVTWKYCFKYNSFLQMKYDKLVWPNRDDPCFIIQLYCTVPHICGRYQRKVRGKRPGRRRRGMEKLEGKCRKAKDKSLSAYVCLNLTELCRKRQQNNLLCAKEKRCSSSADVPHTRRNEVTILKRPVVLSLIFHILILILTCLGRLTAETTPMTPTNHGTSYFTITVQRSSEDSNLLRPKLLYSMNTASFTSLYQLCKYAVAHYRTAKFSLKCFDTYIHA